MSNSLLNIVAQVRQGADTIATASSQIASGNLDLSRVRNNRPVRWKKPHRPWKN